MSMQGEDLPFLPLLSPSLTSLQTRLQIPFPLFTLHSPSLTSSQTSRKCAPAAVATPASTRFSSFAPTFAFHSKSPISRSRLKQKISPSPFRTHAVVDDDEWGKEAGATVEDPPAEVLAVVSEVDKLKQKLKDLLYGTDRGLKASSETRAEIVELITQLEAQNPTPAPTDALALLNGKWVLAFTTFSGLFPLLGSGQLPELVKVEEISQTIDSETFTVQNSVKISGPLVTTSVITKAKFEVRSPKRVQIKFEEGIIGTPQLTDDIVLPDKVEFLGQSIDLSPFNGVISSIQSAASSVARSISGQPPLKIPISNTNAQSWLLTTYLDEELRISRGDAGSIFVLTKETSSPAVE